MRGRGNNILHGRFYTLVLLAALLFSCKAFAVDWVDNFDGTAPIRLSGGLSIRKTTAHRPLSVAAFSPSTSPQALSTTHGQPIRPSV